MCIDIRIVTDKAELEQVYRLRYEIYVEEMGRPQKHADHHSRTVIEPLDERATIFGAFDGARLVGTLRVNMGTIADGFYPEFYGMRLFQGFFPHRTSVTCKLMVRPEFRASPVGIRLCKAGVAEDIARGVRFDFIDCNTPLISLYEKFGYRQVLPDEPHPEYGVVRRLVNDFLDLDHLRRVRSPFASLVPPDLAAAPIDWDAIREAALSERALCAV